MAALASVLALAGIGTAPSAAAHPPTAATAATAVPWSRVGPGWFLTLVNLNPPSRSDIRPVVLYLVGPGGARWELKRWAPGGTILPPWQITAWSPNGRFALLPRYTPAGHPVLTELELATGHQTNLRMPSNTQLLLDAGYTRPTGANLVVERDEGSAGVVLERRSRSGALLATLRRDPTGISWVYARDGRSVVVGSFYTARRAVVVTNTGQLVRRLDGRPGGCAPVKWWTSTAVLAACHQQGSAYHRLWLLPVTGGTARALTAAPTNPSIVDFGFVNAWRTSTRTYLQWTGDCGAARVKLLTTGSHWRAVSIPRSVGADTLVDSAPARLGIWSQQTCDATGGWLGWYSTGTGVRTLLQASPAGTTGLTSVRRYASP